MSDTMTETVYTFICGYLEENEMAPTIREIADACYINVATVIRYLDKLEYQQRLTRVPGRARSIRRLPNLN